MKTTVKVVFFCAQRKMDVNCEYFTRVRSRLSFFFKRRAGLGLCDVDYVTAARCITRARFVMCYEWRLAEFWFLNRAVCVSMLRGFVYIKSIFVVCR